MLSSSLALKANVFNCGAGEQKSVANRMGTHKEIVQRRRMVELSKAQSQEVAMLRAEVERLRMRTFAALVQVDR